MQQRAWLVVGVTLAVSVAVAAPASPAPAPAEVTCRQGGGGTTQIRPRLDVELGPLVVIGAGRTAGHRPNGFGGHGYKLPVTLPDGVVATLSVPAEQRGRVGLVFRHRVQDRVWREGVRAADRSVRFVSCSGERGTGRTGWPGGIVVDRPRCATLVVTVDGGPVVRRRVPLGRAC